MIRYQKGRDRTGKEPERGDMADSMLRAEIKVYSEKYDIPA